MMQNSKKQICIESMQTQGCETGATGMRSAWSAGKGRFPFFAVIVAAVIAPSGAFGALSFNGTNQFVTFGRARNLGSPTFTIETWFNWTGGGVAANTGNGGVMAIPLVTKLSAETDGDNRDGNYFLGIQSPGGVLAADME